MGVVVGFQLKVKKNKQSGDNTATNDIRIVCGQYDRPLWTVNISQGEQGGDYGTIQLCPPLMAVCGIRTQIDDPSEGGTFRKNTYYIWSNKPFCILAFR